MNYSCIRVIRFYSILIDFELPRSLAFNIIVVIIHYSEFDNILIGRGLGGSEGSYPPPV